MSDDSQITTPPALQFDRAVFDQDITPALSCQLCQTPIASAYFEVNGQPTCPACRDQLVASVGVDPGMRGVFAAVMAGIGAAVAGALLYYAVLAITGYEVGLIAVVVGLMVGHAVKWGSGGRGGRRYQILAVTLTYLAIISTYVPFVFAGIDQAQSQAQESTLGDPPAAGAPVDGAADAMAVPADSTQEAPPPSSPGELAIAVAIMVGLLLALPFLAGLGNVIGWLIIGFALWEAWKANRPVSLEVNGPFQVAAGTPMPPVPATS